METSVSIGQGSTARSSAELLHRREPATGAPLPEVAVASAEEVRAAVAQARTLIHVLG